jgi:ATP-binding cassette subfamily F protein 3
MERVSVGYEPDRPVLNDLNFSIYPSDRIALLGSNGNGKTTLARLISGRLEPFKGEVVATSKLKAGYFSQDLLEQFEPTLNAIEQMSMSMPQESPQTVRGWLGRFGLGQDKIDIPIRGLSGGEKTRLALAAVAVDNPNLLILDEPTNHLDMDSRKALIQSLLEYTGAVVLISHDRHLIEATSDQLWLVSSGKVTAFHGDLDDYRRHLFEEKRQDAVRRAPTTKDRKDERRLKAESRARLSPLKKEVAQAEARLEKLLEEKNQIDDALSDPSTYGSNNVDISSLSKRKLSLESQILTAEELWLQAQAALEKQLAEEK